MTNIVSSIAAWHMKAIEKINPALREFVEREILPLYDTFDKAHRRDHALTVIEQSLLLARHYPVDINMVYAIAAFHDTGLREGREQHHTASAIFVRGAKRCAVFSQPMPRRTTGHRTNRCHALYMGKLLPKLTG